MDRASLGRPIVSIVIKKGIQISMREIQGKSMARLNLTIIYYSFGN